MNDSQPAHPTLQRASPDSAEPFSAHPATVPIDAVTANAAEPNVGPRYGRFAVQRLHAKGGLGEVHVALDEELKRDVALKCIQERCAHDPSARPTTKFIIRN
jgi:hypothetical protein